MDFSESGFKGCKLLRISAESEELRFEICGLLGPAHFIMCIPASLCCQMLFVFSF